MSEIPPPAQQNLQLKYDLINDKYPEFIGELRLKVCDNGELSHGRPILPLEADADPPYIDVYLQENGMNKGLARIRRYDLRLINFQDPFGNSLNVDEFQIYDDHSRLVDFGIEGFLLGLPTLVEAVNSLVNFCKMHNDSKSNVDLGTSFLVMCDSKKPTNLEYNFNVRKSLPVLCLVLCEATKLDLLSCILGNAFKFGYKVPLSSWLLYCIHDWGFFSKELLTGDIHFDSSDCDIFLPYHKNDWHDGRRLIGVTCQDVAQCLGILQAVPLPPEPMEEEEELISGERLVEIHSVSVYINGGRSGSVYGNIKVHNHDGAFSIYKRDSTECESIESHGILSLQDFNGFFIVENLVEIELDLLEGGDNSEISKGKALWDGCVYTMFDSRISCLVRGKNGYAIVYYTVLYKAILAVVEATLLRKGHPHASDDVCVCGRLSAGYSYLAYVTDAHERYFQTTLFNKPVRKELSALPCTLEAGTCNRVKLQEAIKLSRSRVSVPVGVYLILKADLKNCEGKPIVSGSIKFFAKEFGECEGIMEGHPNDSHLLQVKVKWIKSQRDRHRKSD